MVKKTLILLLLPALVGCESPGNAAADGLDTASINQLAGRMCRAISIRQQRFALANAIRFAQDTIATAKTPADRSRLQTRLDGYLYQKQILYQQSVNLADTIHKQMDAIIPYADKKKEAAFNTYLNKTLAKKGCAAGS